MIASLLIFLIILTVLIFAGRVAREQFNVPPAVVFDPTFTSSGCVCAFDLDGTITCGIGRAAAAVSKCKELGCRIAINTARPTKWYDDLDLHGLGLTKDDFDSDTGMGSDFYFGEPFNCSFADDKCMEDSIANTKVRHLHTLSSKWRVSPSRVILFDDLYSNTERAKESGFSAVLANNYLGGLPNNVVELISDILH